jgi:hypothetical protein
MFDHLKFGVAVSQIGSQTSFLTMLDGRQALRLRGKVGPYQPYARAKFRWMDQDMNVLPTPIAFATELARCRDRMFVA